MTETVTTAEQEVTELAPAPQLPAVQERKPRLPAQPKQPRAPGVAKLIIAVMREVAHVQKLGVNEFQKYHYMKWEHLNEAVSPLLAKHGLGVIQTEVSRIFKDDDKGSMVTIVYHFIFFNEDDERMSPVEASGAARYRDQKGIVDDKFVLKASTSARKKVYKEQFNVLTEEEDTEERSDTLPKKNSRDIYDKLQEDIKYAKSEVELVSWVENEQTKIRINVLPRDWRDILRDLYKEKLADFRSAPRQIWADPQTGEIIKETDVGEEGSTVGERGSTSAAAPATSNSQPLSAAGAATTTESFRLAAIDTDLEAAAKKGTAELIIAWGKVFPGDRKILNSAYVKRYVPMALKADELN